MQIPIDIMLIIFAKNIRELRLLSSYYNSTPLVIYKVKNPYQINWMKQHTIEILKSDMRSINTILENNLNVKGIEVEFYKNNTFAYIPPSITYIKIRYEHYCNRECSPFCSRSIIDVSKFTKLETLISLSNIYYFKGIDKLVNLQHLHIECRSIDNLQLIQALPNLVSLDLYVMCGYFPEVIPYMPNLTSLTLEGNYIVASDNVPNLTELTLRHPVNICDLSRLSLLKILNVNSMRDHMVSEFPISLTSLTICERKPKIDYLVNLKYLTLWCYSTNEPISLPPLNLTRITFRKSICVDNIPENCKITYL